MKSKQTFQQAFLYNSLSIELVPCSCCCCSPPWIPVLLLRRSVHLIWVALAGYGSFRGFIYVKFKPVVIHYDSPLALQLFLHSKFCHDLVRLHGHPVLNGVNFGVFETWATNMALNYFLLFDAQFTDAARERIELGFENHTRLLVIVVLQPMKVIILLNIFHISTIVDVPSCSTLHHHLILLPILLLMLVLMVLLPPLLL